MMLRKNGSGGKVDEQEQNSASLQQNSVGPPPPAACGYISVCSGKSIAVAASTKWEVVGKYTNTYNKRKFLQNSDTACRNSGNSLAHKLRGRRSPQPHQICKPLRH
mmetsp:Transcript_81840/g.162490  ORF Transcript_81840/g.162490 Transcript_81840/m.162490 type:complete len:106 (+) Transcript_81840:244-561(+)